MAVGTSCGGIKWPSQQFGIKNANSAANYTFTCANMVSGVQAVGMNANFDLQPVFQLTQSEIYELNEGLPQIEMTVNRVLDGTCPTYLMASVDAPNPTLFGRTPCKSILGLAIFPCTNDSAEGTPDAVLGVSGAQVSSIGYNFSVDGPFTEDVTFVANNMLWNSGSMVNHPGYVGQTLNPAALADAATLSFSGCNPNNNGAPRGVTGVAFREDLKFTFDGSLGVDQNGAVADPDATILPPDVYGIKSSGVNKDQVPIQSISVSVDLNREEINILGKRGPNTRTITLPIQVNTNIDVTSDTDHLVSATEAGILMPSGTGACLTARNLINRTIRIATCEGLRIYTGIRNKLLSVSRSGGDTGGGNVTITYSFQTYNTFVVMHENDINPSATGVAGWWANRSNYLVTT